MRTALVGTICMAAVLAVLLASYPAHADCLEPVDAVAYTPDSLQVRCPPPRQLDLTVTFADVRSARSERSEVTFSTPLPFQERWRKRSIGTSVTLWQGDYDPNRPNVTPLTLQGNLNRGARLSLTYSW